MEESSKLKRFERAVLPHLDAAYNLARWLTQNDHDAEDVVQEAYLRAFEFFSGFRGEDGRPWLLTIVRNTCYTWLQQNRPHADTEAFDEEMHTPEGGASNPEELLLQNVDSLSVKKALEELPWEFREVMILREFEGLSYREISEVAGIRVGTVMSRLARARTRLRQSLARETGKER